MGVFISIMGYLVCVSIWFVMELISVLMNMLCLCELMMMVVVFVFCVCCMMCFGGKFISVCCLNGMLVVFRIV